MPPIPDYRLTTRIRNNRILRRIEDAGYSSVAAFCRQHGINYPLLIALVTMRRPPVGKSGKWLVTARMTADALDCAPDDLFNERQIVANLETRTIEHEVDEPTLSLEDRSVLQIETDTDTTQSEYRDTLRSLLAKGGLTERERFIVMRRYGLDDETGDGEWTLQELADKFGISRDRVRQIEMATVRKLRSKVVKTMGIKELHGTSSKRFYDGIRNEWRSEAEHERDQQEREKELRGHWRWRDRFEDDDAQEA